MALGYPNIPGFTPTLAAEAATIAARLTTSRGRIAATPTEYFAGSDLLLITARVRGGFSGGPVLDALGQVVGMVSREPASAPAAEVAHRYDQLGYGVAIPARHLRELLDRPDLRRAIDMTGTDCRAF